MKKPLYFIIILFSISILTNCIREEEIETKILKSPNGINESEKNLVIKVVKDFGDRLKMVSLLAPREILEKNMIKNYGDLVTKELIKKWLSEPLNAPGRLTSSPWPDRIEIKKINKVSKEIYEVKGDIIEITSKEINSRGVAARRSITLLVKKINNKWFIYSVTLGEYE